MSTCTECGATLDPGVAEGLCPRCLLGAGLDEPTPAAAWAPPTAESLASLFPQFEVIELIGQGGMGAVYKARQTKLDRFVALKVLPPELGAAPQFAERFLREARTLAKLTHPNIVSIHDFGEAQGLYYVVMEYVDGRNLRQLLQAGRLDPAHALHLVPQICEGLQYAHENGIVHRDIKPENVLVDAAGRVRIADFGLAKLTAPSASEYTLTGTHQVMGTFRYMAPEQMERPGQVDHRADIYALGVVFYEMLTGQLPMGNFPPPSEKSSAPPHLDPVVMKTLEREPEARYDSAMELKRAVETPPPAQPTQPPRRRAAAAVKPSKKESSLYLRVLIGGLVGFVAMFMTWVSLPWEAFEREAFGFARETEASDADKSNPFDSLLRDNPMREALRNRTIEIGAWDSSFFGIPNGILGLVCLVLSGMAGVSMSSEWRAPWKAFAFPAAYTVIHVLVFMIAMMTKDGTPHIGAFLTLAVAVLIVLSAWLMRPAPAPAARPRKRRRR